MPTTTDDPVHTLEDLAEEVGKPKLSLLPSLLAGSSDADLINRGPSKKAASGDEGASAGDGGTGGAGGG